MAEYNDQSNDNLLVRAALAIRYRDELNPAERTSIVDDLKVIARVAFGFDKTDYRTKLNEFYAAEQPGSFILTKSEEREFDAQFKQLEKSQKEVRSKMKEFGKDAYEGQLTPSDIDRHRAAQGKTSTPYLDAYEGQLTPEQRRSAYEPQSRLAAEHADHNRVPDRPMPPSQGVSVDDINAAQREKLLSGIRFLQGNDVDVLRIQTNWASVVGQDAAKHSRPIDVVHGQLIVDVAPGGKLGHKEIAYAIRSLQRDDVRGVQIREVDSLDQAQKRGMSR